MNNFQGNSRAKTRAKRKKTNFILNGSIAIVIILLAFVSYSIFSSGGNKAASQNSDQASAEKQSTAKKNSTSNQTNAGSTSQEQNQNDQTNSDTTSAGNSSSSSSDSSQSGAITSPAPETPGQTGQQDATSSNSSASTSPAPETPAQTGQQHVTNYDSSSQDWQEMLQSISSSTGIEQTNMTVWWLGSDKSNPGGSVGVVSAKAKGSQKYRVYLQWDGSGYKTTKVEPAS